MKLKYLSFNARGNSRKASGKRRRKIQNLRKQPSQDTKQEQLWKTGWSEDTLQRWIGRKKKKKHITQDKTSQDNEAQMGLIRAMIENCEEQNKGLISFTTLKVKSCF